MPKFRKKPVVIEAWRVPATEPGETFSGGPEWLVQAWHAKAVTAGFDGDSDWMHLNIHTLEGVMKAEADDWIIQGVKGELYPCKPDIFAATYEPVPDDPRWTQPGPLRRNLNVA